MMTKKELRQWLINNGFNKKGNKIAHWNINKNEIVLLALHNFTDYLPEETSLSIRFFCFLNDQNGLHKCLYCGKEIIPKPQRSGLFCSNVCSNRSTHTKDRIKDSLIQKYNVSSAAKSPTVREKIKKTNLKRYGCEWTLASNIVRKKSEATMLKRYGVANPGQSPLIRKKIEKTALDRYGNIHAIASHSVRQKTKETLQERYGVNNPSNIPRVRELLRELNTPCKHMSTEQIYILRSKELFTAELALYGSSLADRLNIHITTLYRYARKYGISKEYASIFEMRWLNFLKEVRHDLDISTHVRDLIPTKEIDLYIPAMRLGIECDGVYWHTNRTVDNQYHLNKTLSCVDKDVDLLHIFDSDDQAEWEFELYCRLLPKEKPTNIELVHTDNCCAIIYNNEVVSTLEFLPMGKNKYELCLSERPGFNCLDIWASELPNISRGDCFCTIDRRRGNGDTQYNLGMQLVEVIGPQAWYTTDYLSLSPTPSSTDDFVIYDCGQLKFVF